MDLDRQALDDAPHLSEVERLLVAVGEHLLHAGHLLPPLLEAKDRGRGQHPPLAAALRPLGERVQPELVSDGLHLDENVAVIGVVDVVLRVELEAAKAVVRHRHLHHGWPHRALGVQLSVSEGGMHFITKKIFKKSRI